MGRAAECIETWRFEASFIRRVRPVSGNWEPRNLTKIEATSRRASFQWEAPNFRTKIGSFRVSVYTMTDFKRVFRNYTDNTKIIVDGLQPNTEYEIYVAGCAVGERSVCFTARTQEFRTPTDGDFFAIFSSSEI